MTYNAARPHLPQTLPVLGAEALHGAVVKERVERERLVFHEHTQVRFLASEVRAVHSYKTVVSVSRENEGVG